ncbi:MAG: hypothetical protein C0429_17510 [Sphingopyxis sp.]|nr:hypothetical protein [Sphingopyxis sp.]
MRLHFLPRRFSKLGNYSDAQRHLAGAYRIFFNAELENYFEVTARNLAKFAEDQWAAGRPTMASSALCSRNSGNIGMPQETSLIKNDRFLDTRFSKELDAIRKSINSNNGAKSSNILLMFVPLGVDETKINPQLLSECDSLGSDRGFLAHQTAGAAVYLIDPRTEYDRTLKIQDLIDEFERGIEYILQ